MHVCFVYCTRVQKKLILLKIFTKVQYTVTRPLQYLHYWKISLVSPMDFYFHSIFIEQINEYPMKITNENSMKNNFMEYSLVKFQWIFICKNVMKILGHPLKF